MYFDDLFTALVGCLTSFVLGALIILTQRWHGIWTHDSHEGVQKFHTQPTPRIGGLAILIGSFASLLVLSEELKEFSLPWLLAGLIPFAFGFVEDVTKQVSVVQRLLATMVGALVAVVWTGIYLNRLDVWVIDAWMGWWPLGVLVTMVAISGVTNAINILDGFNGLASGTALVILAVFAYMSHQVHDAALFGLCFLVGGVILGFMLLNYPFGKIFLGDAGAYFVGFILGWIALLLPMRHDNISPWASLLTCAYPVTEVLYSMMRRTRTKLQAGQPDSLHLHSSVSYTHLTLPTICSV